MGLLRDALRVDDRRTEIVDDCCRLLDNQVASKKGLSGMAVKGGYKVLKALKPGAVREAVDGLLDDFIEAMETFHDEWKKKGDGSFGQYLNKEKDRVAESLVCVTDERAKKTRHQNLRKIYDKLRPSAVAHVQAAVPELAELIDKYLQ
ncbi:MAG: hypothetical protein D6806_02610 [Deltaproteobacteria bacterium]|nr:MAG: hypothetical protein D6806_02610 [Deltaproteobacteria bacterium]